MQRGGDVAADGGLAAADFAGEQADASQFEQVLQARLGFAAGGRGEQLVGVEVGLEREAGEGKVAQVHQSSSCCRRSSLRRASGEGGGWAGGVSDSICQEGRTRLTEALA